MIKISTRSTNQKQNEFMLLELNDELVKALEEQQVLEFKGDGDEDAVLCSKSNTYLLKNRMHSNSLTLLDQAEAGDGAYEIVNTFHEILEVHKSVPNIDKIGKVLSHRVLLDPTEPNKDVDRNLVYGYDRLSSEIQASDEEIRQALTTRRIVNFNGEYRPIDPECLMRTLDLIANTLELLGLSLSNLEKDKLVDAIQQEHRIDKEYTSTVMSWYMSSPTSIDAKAFVSEIGLCLLKAQKQPTSFDAFTDNWKSKAGYELSSQCTLDLLKGSYLIEAGKISFFTTSHLSKVPSTRFQELFKMRPKWFAADFLPFIKDLGDGKELERMIMKFCRTQTDKSTAMETYTSRQRT